MSADHRVSQIIEKAEKSLAALAAEAASARNYASAAKLLAIAQRVADAAQAEGGVSGASHQLLPQPTTPPSQHGLPVRGQLNTEPSKESPLSAKKTTSTPYPRFEREDDALVKIGWSKSDKTTYEHRSPRAILQNLVRHVDEIGGNGLRFTTEQLLPLTDERGEELPSYQCYLCLAWLVAEGLVNRHGRQGYTLSVHGNLRAAVEVKWQSLPRR